MKVELIHPPHFNSTDDRLDPPLGLLHIGSYIKKKLPGEGVVINDLSGVDSGKKLSVGVADIYGITAYCSTLGTVADILAMCREANPDAVIVAGGAHTTARPDDMLGMGFDHAVVGYGEIPMVSLMTRGDQVDRIIHGRLPEEEQYIDWSLVDPGSYSRVIGGEKSLPLLTMRGCPFRCNFCGLHRMHELTCGIAYQTIESVEVNLKNIRDAGFNAVNIQDDTISVNRKRMAEVLECVYRHGMKFRCMVKPRADDKETYKILSEYGCTGVSFGIESGSQKILDLMNKRQLVEDGLNAIQWCNEYGMDSRAFFILGFPGETRKTIETTRKFIVAADPDQYFISKFVPYPGTPVWNDPVKFGITRMSYDFDDYFQVGKNGFGGNTISTKWLSMDELMWAEFKLRNWLMVNKPLRGINLQEYEK